MYNWLIFYVYYLSIYWLILLQYFDLLISYLEKHDDSGARDSVDTEPTVLDAKDEEVNDIVSIPESPDPGHVGEKFTKKRTTM